MREIEKKEGQKEKERWKDRREGQTDGWREIGNRGKETNRKSREGDNSIRTSRQWDISCGLQKSEFCGKVKRDGVHSRQMPFLAAFLILNSSLS